MTERVAMIIVCNPHGQEEVTNDMRTIAYTIETRLIDEDFIVTMSECANAIDITIEKE